MKIFLGILSTLLVLAGTILATLAIWGIYPISGEIIWKAGLTLLIISAALVLLWLILTLFFKKEKHKNTGNKAHLID